MYLFFDTETTGLPKVSSRPAAATDNWPRMVTVAWALFSNDGQALSSMQFHILPDGFTIPPAATAIHGITTEQAMQKGIALNSALHMFSGIAAEASILVAHNFNFDYNVLKSEMLRCGLPDGFSNKQFICTMKSTVKYCAIPSTGKGFKYPTLAELYYNLFKSQIPIAHSALADTLCCAKCFFELKRLQAI